MLDMKGVVVQSVRLDSTNQQPDLGVVLHVEQEKLQCQQAQMIKEIVVSQIILISRKIAPFETLKTL